ncbi:ufm1-specific protease 1 [Caerostris extrusa]|uniref:Ufm1-specific protease 1 n=1 Tax=Caerostris extrusa TaxID=172846 RepID=A0AAV4T0K7_CAEEX|nr:ufm1-specific protease 1 [Caerostris extrusa]
MENLIKDIHLDLPLPTNEVKSFLVRGTYFYYHYKCDGTNDVGWGCGYRTLQTICSWIKEQLNHQKLDSIPEIECRILHCRNISELQKHFSDIKDHFVQYGSPVMMGGDRDCSSKGILGISETDESIFLLILDPHFTGHPKYSEKLQNDGWIKWQNIDELHPSSFL